ncbi:MAG TPA: hypothetical protein VFK89_04775 [Actinomycetota bacterium]|nr:hypothetical protein [Actinomycetota bacterium]
MTRIVLDPAELGRVADQILQTSDAYREIAGSIRDRARPEMPEALADAIGAGLDGVLARIETLSSGLDAQCYLLRTRAAVLESEIASRVLLDVGRELDE